MTPPTYMVQSLIYSGRSPRLGSVDQAERRRAEVILVLKTNL